MLGWQIAGMAGLAILITSQVIGIYGYILVRIRASPAEPGWNRIALLLFLADLFVILVANLAFLTWILSMWDNGRAPGIIQGNILALAALATFFAFFAAAVLKHWTSKIQPHASPSRMTLFLAAQLVLVPWAGATTSLISGGARAIAYHADYAAYTPSKDLAAFAALARSSSDAWLQRKIEACRQAAAVLAGAPRDVSLVDTRSWLWRQLGSGEILYAVQPVGHPYPALAAVRYRFTSNLADRQLIESGTYIFAGRGAECRVSTKPIAKERIVPSAELRSLFEGGAATLASTAARNKTHPLPWAVLASSGAAKDLGFSGVSLTPANPAAERLDVALFWFQKIAFGLIMLMLLAPFKFKPKQEAAEAADPPLPPR